MLDNVYDVNAHITINTISKVLFLFFDSNINIVIQKNDITKERNEKIPYEASINLNSFST